MKPPSEALRLRGGRGATATRSRALSRVQARQYVEIEPRRRRRRGRLRRRAAGIACVNLVMIRGGRHVGDRSFFPRNAEGAAPDEVVEAFLEQHYLEQPMPPRSSSTRADARSEAARRAGRTSRHAIRIGERARLARHGAQERAARDRAAACATAPRRKARLLALREALGLPEGAQRIECFDISHTMGEATVASCVVYDRQQMQKSRVPPLQHPRRRRRATTTRAMRQVLDAALRSASPARPARCRT